MIHYYVYANVQDQSNGYTFYVWKIGLQIISKREKMIIVSFIHIMKQIVSYANIAYQINSNIKVDRILFWTLVHFSHHMLNFNMFRWKIIKGNFINILFP